MLCSTYSSLQDTLRHIDTHGHSWCGGQPSSPSQGQQQQQPQQDQPPTATASTPFSNSVPQVLPPDCKPPPPPPQAPGHGNRSKSELEATTPRIQSRLGDRRDKQQLLPQHQGLPQLQPLRQQQRYPWRAAGGGRSMSFNVGGLGRQPTQNRWARMLACTSAHRHAHTCTLVRMCAFAFACAQYTCVHTHKQHKQHTTRWRVPMGAAPAQTCASRHKSATSTAGRALTPATQLATPARGAAAGVAPRLRRLPAHCATSPSLAPPAAQAAA